MSSSLLAACSNSGSTPLKACPQKTVSQEGLIDHSVQTDLDVKEISDNPQYDILEAVLKQSGLISSDTSLEKLGSLTTANIVSTLVGKGYTISSASSWDGFMAALGKNMIETDTVYPIMVKMPNRVFPPTVGKSGENWMGVFGCKTTESGKPVTLLICSPAQVDNEHTLYLEEVSFDQLECLVNYYGADEKIEVIF